MFCLGLPRVLNVFMNEQKDAVKISDQNRFVSLEWLLIFISCEAWMGKIRKSTEESHIVSYGLWWLLMTIEFYGCFMTIESDGLRSTNVHMSTTQIGLLQSVYRTRKKLTRRGLAFWLLQQNGQGQISLCIQHQLHHKEHMNACNATISVSGTCGLSEDHVDACSATISVSGTRGAEDHVHACKRHHFRFRNTWAG